jgi:hypothetical protein
LREDEPVAGDDKLIDRRIGKSLVEDVTDDRRHLAGHRGEAIWPQLLEQELAHLAAFRH